MGAGGTDPPVGYDLMSDVGIEGDLVDQRGPHYFDIRAEAVFLKRDKSFDQNIDFTSQNVGNVVVLSSSQLDIEDVNGGLPRHGSIRYLPAVRRRVWLHGHLRLGRQRSRFTDPTNNLFSLFSRPAPGNGPVRRTSPPGVNLPGGPNPFTERATTHSIELSSDLQTAEISYRRYWLGYIPRVSGTLLAGFRYTRVNENFVFASQGSEQLPQQQNQGPQLAALGIQAKMPRTTWPVFKPAATSGSACRRACASAPRARSASTTTTRGWRIGFPQRRKACSRRRCLKNSKTTTSRSSARRSIDLVADIMPSLSVRVGYEVLFLNELVLAGDNFNQTSPYGNQGRA